MTVKEKRTIGVILPSLHENVQSLVWPGIAESAKKHNVKLITYVATSQDQISSLDLHYKIVRDFVKKSDIDGVIIFSGAMAEHKEIAEVRRFCRSFKDIPVVCIALSVPKIPSVLVDNRAGIIEIVNHLVTKHNRRRIAFVKGPEGHEEAEDRFSAYCKGLALHNLPVLNSLVLPGNFSDDSGMEAVTTLVTKKIKFDAIVTADDETAFGVIQELKKRDIKIPAEVAVAGFDDVTEAAFVMPSLTTVRQPLYKQGRQAFLTLLDRCNGKKVTTVIHLPTESVHRRSCGCFSEITVTMNSALIDPNKKISKSTIIASVCKKISYTHETVLEDSNISPHRLKGLIKELVEDFIKDAEADSSRDLFLNSIDHLLLQVESHDNTTAFMLELISTTASFIPSLFKENTHAVRANQLIQQAIVFINEHAIKVTQSQNIQQATRQLRVRETAQKLITTFEQDRLLRVIADEFPDLDIQSCFFALYEGKKMPIKVDKWRFPQKSVLLLGFRGDTRYVATEADKSSFPSSSLIPDNRFKTGDLKNLIFMPLFFETEHFGFIVFEHDPTHQFFMYEELRLHLSSALKSSFMLDELKTQSIRDELTNLYNRRGFINLSKKMIDSSVKGHSEVWIFYIDLDGLKSINDTYGHEEGDFAIAGAARILVDTFRKQDVIGRMGGDEFTVILATDPKYKPERSIRSRLKINIEKFNKKAKKPFKISMSVGACKFTNMETETLESVMKKADDQMISRKRKKKRARR